MRSASGRNMKPGEKWSKERNVTSIRLLILLDDIEFLLNIDVERGSNLVRLAAMSTLIRLGLSKSWLHIDGNF